MDMRATRFEAKDFQRVGFYVKKDLYELAVMPIVMYEAEIRCMKEK